MNTAPILNLMTCGTTVLTGERKPFDRFNGTVKTSASSIHFKTPMKSKNTLTFKDAARHVLGALVLALALPGAAPRALAQATFNPPERMTYQGYLTDANGFPLATNAPKNYDIIFSIYNDANAGILLWNEQQTVTVDRGNFSVLLGEGTSSSQSLHGDLSTLFTNSTASDRWVAITVKGIGSGGADASIVPRLRLLSTPYAFLAKRAREVDGTALTTGTIPDARLSANVALRNTNNSFAASQFINANLTVDGVLQSATLTNTGNAYITALRTTNLTVTGSANVSGALSTGSATVTNALSAGSATVSGALSSASATVSGTLSSASATVSGALSSASATVSGALSAGSSSITYANVTGSEVFNNGVAIWGKNTAGVTEPAFWPRADNGTYLQYGVNGFHIRNQGVLDAIYISDNRAVTLYGSLSAAGTASFGSAPADAILNVGGVTRTFMSYGRLSTSSVTTGNFNRADVPLAIHAWGHILATEFDVDSDVRIKTDLHPTDSAQDLDILMEIQITDFRFKDTVANSAAPQKKVIAQQVETVFPQAVNQHKGVVPNIYTNAEVRDGWVQLATDLKPGERVRLITPDADSTEEVLEVRADSFRTTLKPGAEKVFVYGREVPDFHDVDYDAIAMLNVSATQQIKREKDEEIQSLQAENTRLRQELAALQQSVEARLTAIEQHLSPAPQTSLPPTANPSK